MYYTLGAYVTFSKMSSTLVSENILNFIFIKTKKKKHREFIESSCDQARKNLSI